MFVGLVQMWKSRKRCQITALALFTMWGPVNSAHAQSEFLSVTGRIVIKQSPDNERKEDSPGGAVIWLKPLINSSTRELEGKAPTDIPRRKIIQKGKRFDPDIVAVRVGSVIDFPNLDPFFHNVFSLYDGKRFDLGLYESGTSLSVRFDRRGVCFIFCNIHPEMSAVVVVVDTPFYAVSGPDGAFKIEKVPPGRYSWDVWHYRMPPEGLTDFPREVRITSQTSSLGTVSLEAMPDRIKPHKNKYGLDYESTPPTPLSPY